MVFPTLCVGLNAKWLAGSSWAVLRKVPLKTFRFHLALRGRTWLRLLARFRFTLSPAKSHPFLVFYHPCTCVANRAFQSFSLYFFIVLPLVLPPQKHIQGGWGGWPTGNGNKLSSSQAQLGQAPCLAVA